jgi:hypothetical protein
MVLILMVLLSLTAPTPKWSKYSLKMTEQNSFQFNVKGLEAVFTRKSQACTTNLVSFCRYGTYSGAISLQLNTLVIERPEVNPNLTIQISSSLRNYSMLICMHLELQTSL